MTDKQLKQAQDLKRTIAMLENELEKLDQNHTIGINVFLPNVGTLITDVKQVFTKHMEMYNDKFRKL